MDGVGTTSNRWFISYRCPLHPYSLWPTSPSHIYTLPRLGGFFLAMHLQIYTQTNSIGKQVHTSYIIYTIQSCVVQSIYQLLLNFLSKIYVYVTSRFPRLRPHCFLRQKYAIYLLTKSRSIQWFKREKVTQRQSYFHIYNIK